MSQPSAPVAYPYVIPAQNFGPYQNATQNQAATPYLYPYQGPATIAYSYPYEPFTVESVPRVNEPTYQKPAVKNFVPEPRKNAPPKSQQIVPLTTYRVPLQMAKQDSLGPVYSAPPHTPVGGFSPSPTNGTKTTQDGEIDTVDSIPSAANDKKTRWYHSKKVQIALLVLLLLLILLAVIIPILVPLLLSRSPTDTTTTTATTAAPLCARTYSKAFAAGASTASDCAVWQTFVTGLTCSSYSKMRINGTNDPTGLTITSSAVATAIAAALRGNTTYAGSSNGYNWAVGNCGSGYEVTSTGSVCSCNTGYTIRPCILNNNWGAINGATCNAAAQTVSLYFE